MLTKQLISFTLIALYMFYLVFIRILMLFTSRTIEISITWVITHGLLILLFMILLSVQILRLFNIFNNVNSYKAFTYIAKSLDVFYFNANNFLNRFPKIEKTLYKVCSQFIYYCTKGDINHIYVKYLVLPYIIVAFVFLFEACLYKQLFLFYYVLPLTFITMFITYLLYRCEHLYKLQLQELTIKCLIQIADPSDMLYRTVSLQDLLYILIYQKPSEPIKVIITPSLLYINDIISKNQDGRVITRILNDRVQSLIVFRKIQLNLNNIKIKYQPYLSIVLYSAYLIGWSFIMYHNIL